MGNGGGSADPDGPGYTYDGPRAAGDRTRTAHQIQDEIRRGQAAPQPSGPAGGGYTCSLGELRGAVRQVDRMLETAHGDLRQVAALTDAESPARDAEGSVMFTTALRSRGGAVGELIRAQIADLDAYRGYLDGIVRDYGNAEDGHQVTFRDIHRAM